MALRSPALLATLAAIPLGCSADAPGAIDGPEPEPTGQVAYALGTVQDAVSAGCSTTSVFGLSKQIVDQVNCIVPNALAAVPDKPNLSKGSAVFPYLQTAARDSFVAALDDNPSKQLGCNSMLRTVAQQYLLYAWSMSAMCGIQLAATPGNSNHESGLAFDTSDYATWTSAMSAHDFKWFGSSDLVHFDFVGAGTHDLSGKDVLAFQMLWNENNPGDVIGEDGAYGPQTEARLKQSPADGFPKGAICLQAPALDATFVSQGSDASSDPNGKAHYQVCTGQSFHFWFELKNKGTASWTDVNDTTAGNWGKAVRLGKQDDKPDPLTGTSRESVSLNDDTQVDPKGGDCNNAPGCSRTVFTKGAGIAAKAPDTPGIVKTEWRLVDENRGWFGPTMWLDFSVVDCAGDAGTDAVVKPDGAAGAGADAAGMSDSGAKDAGPGNGGKPYNVSPQQDAGCSCMAAGDRSRPAAWLLLLAALGLRRRRSRKA